MSQFQIYPYFGQGVELWSKFLVILGGYLNSSPPEKGLKFVKCHLSLNPIQIVVKVEVVLVLPWLYLDIPLTSL